MAQTIKEFLVGLGFEVKGQGKFVEAVNTASRDAAKLGVTLGAAGAAVALLAKETEQLWFFTQRTGATAGGFNAWSMGLANLGGSAEGAAASMESLASKMRRLPMEGVLQSLGVKQGQHMEGIMHDLGETFKKMPERRGLLYADMLGIDEKTFLAMRQDTGEFSEWYGAMARRFGIDSDDAAKSSNRFMIELRKLGEIGKGLASKEGGVLSTQMAPELEKLARLLEDNADMVGKFVAAIPGISIGVIAMKFPWLALGAAILGAWQDYKTWKEGGESLFDWSKMKSNLDDAKRGWDDYGAAMRNALNPTQEGNVASPSGAQILLDTGKAIFDKAMASHGKLPYPGPPVEGDRASAVRWLMWRGESQDDAVAMAQTAYDESGLSATAKSKSSTAYGAGQWTKSSGRQAEFQKWAGIPLTDSDNLEQQLSFILFEAHGKYREAYERMKGDKAVQDKAHDWRYHYEIPSSDPGERERLSASTGNKAISLSQQITVNINGNASQADIAAGIRRGNEPLTRVFNGGRSQ